jgi:hypothetical protein
MVQNDAPPSGATGGVFATAVPLHPGHVFDSPRVRAIQSGITVLQDVKG